MSWVIEYWKYSGYLDGINEGDHEFLSSKLEEMRNLVTPQQSYGEYHAIGDYNQNTDYITDTIYLVVYLLYKKGVRRFNTEDILKIYNEWLSGINRTNKTMGEVVKMFVDFFKNINYIGGMGKNHIKKLKIS